NLFKPLRRMREAEVDHRLDDRHLARKVVIEVPRTDPGFGADVRRAGATEAVLDEAADCRAEDLAALLLMLDGVDFPQCALSSSQQHSSNVSSRENQN